MITGNYAEDRFLGNLDRRIGVRVSDRTVGNAEYTRSSGLVFRNGKWVDPKPTQPVCPTAPVVAEAVKAEAPKPQFAPAFTGLASEADREVLKTRFVSVRDQFMSLYEDVNDIPRAVIFGGQMLRQIDEATVMQIAELRSQVASFEDILEKKRLADEERIESERLVDATRLAALREQFAKKTEGPPVVTPPEGFTWSVDMSRPKRVKPPKKKVKAKAKATSESSVPTPAESKCEVDCTGLPGRIAELSEEVVAETFRNGRNLTWRYSTKAKLAFAAKNPAGIKHVAAFVTACEMVEWERVLASQADRGQLNRG